MGVRTQISFRLDPYSAERLAGEAAKLGMSVGSYARRLVVDGLYEKDRLREEVALARREVALLSERFRTAVVAILVDAGKAEPDEARAFVEDQLKG